MYILILIVIAGAANGIVDKLRDEIQFKSSKFSKIKNIKIRDWFNPIASWKKKWKLDEYNEVIPDGKTKWYYLWLTSPKYVERFPYSSKTGVGITDAWHLFQRVMFVSLTSCIPLYFLFRTFDIGMLDYTDNMYINIMIDFALIAIALRLSFSAMYDKILKLKE